MKISQTLIRSAQVSASTVATSFNGREKTYAELENRVSKLAGAFQNLGIADNDRVALLMLTSDYSIELFYAIPWAGAAVVPLNFRLTIPELAYMLNDSGSKILVVDDTFAKMLPALKPQLQTVEHIVFTGAGEIPDGALAYEDLISNANAVKDAGRGNDDILGIFYTGGTTGLPKGVMITHNNMMHQCVAVGYLLPREDLRWFTATPMYHVTGSIPVYATVAWAGIHYLRAMFDPEDSIRSIEEFKANISVMVPIMLNMIVNHPAAANHDLSSLDTVLYGGSPMPAAVIKKIRDVMPNCKLNQAYGMTETTGAVTYLTYHDHDPLLEVVKSAGQAFVGSEAKVVDINGDEVERGTIGEILMSGPPVMKGYWNNPEATQQALKDGWIHSGDLGYMDENGYIFVVDRLKDMIITGGENVYSVEVENAIYKHPAVALCAVIGIPDETWGEAIHASIQLIPGQSVTAEEIMAHCKDMLASYKCPKTVEIRTEPMPLSGAGKILKHVLRKQFAEQPV